LKTNVIPSKKFININYVDIIKYLIEDKYKMSDEDILLITRDWIQEHKLYGLSIHMFQGSTIDMINDIYPNRFKPWQYITSGNRYWQDENNVRKALEWFIDQLFKDKVITCLEDIPSSVNGETFLRYELNGNRFYLS
jgi:hypothetical protein